MATNDVVQVMTTKNRELSQRPEVRDTPSSGNHIKE